MPVNNFFGNSEADSRSFKFCPGIQALKNGELPAETEVLTMADQYNEHVMTRLRLEEGVDWTNIQRLFGKTFSDHFNRQLSSIDPEFYQTTRDFVQLTDSGRLWCDKISASLFYAA